MPARVAPRTVLLECVDKPRNFLSERPDARLSGSGGDGAEIGRLGLCAS